MIAAGFVTSWFVAKNGVNFGVVQMMAALLLLTFILAVLAFWPSRRTVGLNRLQRSRQLMSCACSPMGFEHGRT